MEIIRRLFIIFPMYILFFCSIIIFPIPILYWIITGDNYIDLFYDIENL